LCTDVAIFPHFGQATGVAENSSFSCSIATSSLQRANCATVEPSIYRRHHSFFAEDIQAKGDWHGILDFMYELGAAVSITYFIYEADCNRAQPLV
jgi:hypothetical protein